MALITLQEFQDYTGICKENGNQQIYIVAAENILENYLNYSPVETKYVHLFSGSNSSILQLKAKPVILNNVKINENEIPVNEFIINNEFVYYKNGIFPEGVFNIEVDYKGGYSQDTIPGLLKITVLRLAALLETEAQGNIGITSKSFADSGTRTFLNNTDYVRYLTPVSSYCLLRL
jgi:hypothetical protein